MYPYARLRCFGYFLADSLPRNILIDAHNELVRRADERWVFGEISDCVQAEIDLAHSLDHPIRFFCHQHESERN